MSLHYSKYDLNTYKDTPYFKAHIPKGVMVGVIICASRAYRRLPPHLRELSALAKRWTERVWPGLVEHVNEGYDEEGYELHPVTGERLTDAEIDAMWHDDLDLSDLEKIEDIPLPPGGFADPNTWEAPPPEPEEEYGYEGPDVKQLLSDIKGHGRAYVARYYGVPEYRLKSLATDEALAQEVHAMLTHARPAPPTPAPASP